MSINTTDMTQGPLVLVTQQNGVTVIPQPTPLTRLNYFDGKFLRASDLSAEQLYLRRLVDLSNQAGGPGVAHGYNLSLAAGGDTLNLGPGLAIDPQGRVLLLPQAFSIGVQELIEKSRQLQSSVAAASGSKGQFADCTVVAETPPPGVVQAGNLYLITIGFAEALCGTEDVFGKLCEEACATSTDRPYLVEGVVLRAIPLQLQTPLPTSAVVALSQLHLRSRVASSYFEDERKKVASFISGDGLRSNVWCFGAEAAGGLDVPLGVLARAGSTTLFLDAWIARRERIDTPAKRYWQWRMAMRPWDVFLAQILQFQCQLSELFKKPPPAGGGDDPCASAYGVIREASATVAKIASFYQTVTTRFTLQPLLVSGSAGAEKPPTLDLVSLLDFQKRLQALSAAALIPSDKFLIDGGIIELPSAGYLPVSPNSVISVNEQVRRLLGKGVDLRFCIVRPDFVAHALEEAQHMERISLLQGLDNPNNKPKVDILVPDGVILEQKLLSSGLGFEATLDVNSLLFSGNARAATAATAVVVNRNIRFQGAARAEKLSSGGGAVYLGAEFELASGFSRNVDTTGSATAAEAEANPRNASIREMFSRADNPAAVQISNPRAGAWIGLSCERNLFELKRGDTSNFNARGIVAATTVTNTPLLDVELNGILEITQGTVETGGAKTLKGHIENAQFSFLGQAFDDQGLRQTILVDLDATVTLTGGAAIDIVLVCRETQFELQFKLSANWDKQPLEVKAAIAFITTEQTQETTLVAVALKENADVLSAGNINHRQALDALDIIAAALRDVNFVAAKARLLFPPPPTPTDEVIVRATLDWVLFHRRRDKQCSAIIETPEVIPPRSYRVFNITAPNLDQAQVIAKRLDDPVALAESIKELSDSQIDLVIKFAGDSAQPLFDFSVTESQWIRFKPGKVIACVFYGAKGDDNAVLQTNRLRQFESAISADSKENESTTLKPLSPFPEQALPADADGIMLFVTIAALRNALLIYGNWDRVGGQSQHFLNSESPFSPMQFDGNTPQGDTLKKFIAGLTANQPVLGVTLATTKAAPDADTPARLKTVIGALVEAGRPAPVASRQTVDSLNAHDRKELQTIGQNPDSFDEIIFFELNAGE